MLTNCTPFSAAVASLLLLSTLTSCSEDSTDLVFNSSNDEVTDESRIRFTKAANSDWQLVENQDRITSNVWLTRRSQGLLFNAKVESEHNGSGPKGTRWFHRTLEEIEKVGSLEDYSEEQLRSLKFVSMKSASNSRMRDAPGKTFIVHLVEDDVFIELSFHSWGNKSEGGGFSYSRTKVKD